MKCDICYKRKALVQEGAFAVCLKCQQILIERRLERERELERISGGKDARD